MLLFLSLVNCGHPELLLTAISNDSVPRIVSTQYHANQPVVGSTVTFDCPPGQQLIEPSSLTCMDNGEWEPDLSELMCINSSGKLFTSS